MWISRLATLFVGLIVAYGIFLACYTLATVVFVRLLGVTSEAIRELLYWVCLAVGCTSALVLMRRAWPRSPR